MNEYCLDPEDVIELNRGFVQNPLNLLDRGKLESALAAPLRTFGGEFLVSSSLLQGAMLIERVANAQAFIDANKRTAWVCGIS